MDIFEKYGVDKSISSSEFLKLLEDKKEITLRKLNNIFDNPEKESELKRELDEIEAAELIIKNGGSDDSLSTGLFQEEKAEPIGESKSLNLNKNMDDSEMLYEEGYTLEEQGKYERALEYYKKSAELGYTEAQFRLGLI